VKILSCRIERFNRTHGIKKRPSLLAGTKRR